MQQDLKTGSSYWKTFLCEKVKKFCKEKGGSNSFTATWKSYWKLMQFYSYCRKEWPNQVVGWGGQELFHMGVHRFWISLCLWLKEWSYQNCILYLLMLSLSYIRISWMIWNVKIWQISHNAIIKIYIYREGSNTFFTALYTQCDVDVTHCRHFNIIHMKCTILI